MSEYQPRFFHAGAAFLVAVLCAVGASLVPSKYILLIAFLWVCVAFWMYICVRIIGAILFEHKEEKKTNKIYAYTAFMHQSQGANGALVAGAAAKLGIQIPVPEIVYPERVIHQTVKQSGPYIEVMERDIYKVASLLQLQIVANGLLHGLKLRHADFTPARAGKGFSEGQFTRFQEFITDPAAPIVLAKWIDANNHNLGCVLTADGEAFFSTFETE